MSFLYIMTMTHTQTTETMRTKDELLNSIWDKIDAFADDYRNQYGNIEDWTTRKIYAAISNDLYNTLNK